MKVLELVYCPDWEDWPEGCTGKYPELRQCWCRQALEKKPILLAKRAYGYVVTWEDENLE